LTEDDQQQIKNLLKEFEKFKGNKGTGSTPKGKASATTKVSSPQKAQEKTPEKRKIIPQAENTTPKKFPKMGLMDTHKVILGSKNM